MVETNIHFPTESSLIWDGVRKIIPLCIALAEHIGAPGWRQAVQTQRVQELHAGEIKKASFDRGFYSPENEIALSQIVSSPCVPPRHPTQFAEKLKEASVEFQQSRKRHPGIESAIGSLQSGNGLKRCRDRSELGLQRYVALAILGRNLHTLGKLIIGQVNAKCEATRSKRQPA